MVDPLRDHDDRESVPTISELIHTQRDATGLTYRQMADRAAASGHPVKYQQFQELATRGPKGWPKDSATVKGLAFALEVSERSIVLAFARSFGLDVSEGSSLLEVLLPAGTRDVDPGLQQAIAGVVRAAVQAQHESEATSDGPPIAPEVVKEVTHSGDEETVDLGVVTPGKRSEKSSRNRDHSA